MAKRADLKVEFKVVYVPLPPHMEEARRASLLLLLQWIKEDLILHPEEESNEVVDGDSNGHDGGVRPALFPVAGVAQRKRTAKAGRVHAWIIGNDGSAYRVVMGSWTN